MSENTTRAITAEGRESSGLLHQALQILIGLKLLLLPLIFDVNSFASFDAPKAALSHSLAWLMFFVIAAIVFKEHLVFQSFLNSPLKGIHLAVLAFIFSAIISTIFAADRYIAVFGYPYRMLGLATILDLGILYAGIVISVKKIQDFRIIIWSFLAGAVISSMYALLQYFKLDVFVWGSQLGARVFSTFGNPDFYGQYLSVLVIALIGVIVFQPLKWRYRTVLVIFLIGTLYLVGAVGTRSAIIGIVAGMTIIAAVWLKRTSLKRNAIMMIGLLTLTGGIIVAVLLSQTYIREKLTWYWIRRGIIQRGIIYETVLREFADHPIFGVGPDNLGVLYFQYRPVRELDLRGPFYLDSSAHGWPMQVLATQGLVGFAIFLVILFVAAKTAWTLIPHSRYGPFASIIAAALAAHYGTGLLTPNSISTEWIGWTGIALLAAVHSRALADPHCQTGVSMFSQCACGYPRVSSPPMPSSAFAGVASEEGANAREKIWKPLFFATLLGVTLFGISLSIRPWLASRYAAIPVFLLKAQGNTRDHYLAWRSAIKSTELDPGRADLWKFRANTEEYLGNLRAAVESFQEAARLSPDYPEHWWNLARINVRLVEQGDKSKKDAAFFAMQQAIASDPNGPESYAASAKLLLLLGENQQALEAAQKGIALFHTKPDYYILAATAAHRLGKSEEAEKILKESIDIFSVTGIGLSAPLYLSLAELYRELHEIKKSEEQLAIVLERDPNNADALAIRDKLFASSKLKK